MRKAKIFIINGFILTISSLILRGVGLLFNIYIANQVGQETIGIFSLVMSVYIFAITFATSGIGLACTCLVSENFAKKNYLVAFKTVRTCIFFAFILSLCTAIFILIFSNTISNTWLKSSVSSMPIYAIALGLPFISISNVLNGYFSSVNQSYKSAISQCFELFIKIIATTLLLHQSITKNIDAICTSLILGDVISEFFSFSLNLLFYHLDRKKYRLERSYTTNIVKRIFRISFPVAITSYIRSGLSSLKQFLIPVRLQVSGLNYSLAISKYGLINGMVMPILTFASLFINSFSTLLVPEYSRLLTGKNLNRIKTVSNKIFKIAFIFSFFIASIFLFFANEISLIIYHNLESAIYIRLFAPLVILMYTDNIIDNILKGINAQFSVMCVNICDLIITILIIYFAVPFLGVNGYILSIFVSEFFNFIISFLLLKNKIKFSFNFLYLAIKLCLFSAISYFISNFICFTYQSFTIYAISKIIVFSFIYVILFFIDKLLSP